MAGAAGGFVTRAFEAMLKECNASRGKFAALQQSIQSYLDAIKGAAAAQEQQDDGGAPVPVPVTQVLASAGRVLEGTQAELVLQPLRLAFETKHIKLVEPALDCLHKLIAYDHLEGDPGLEDGKNSPLFTDILNMVCGCVDNTSSDSTVLQVLKVLLNAVASNRFRVHGEPLLGVIRVCYNIALNSKSPVNQATSKAMLTQMISIVFRRMESEQVSVPAASSAVKDTPSSSTKDVENGEISTDNQDEEKTTLGDALSINRASEASPTSVEELQTLAGGADIKGLEAVLDKAVELEDGKKVSGGIDLDTMNIIQRDALLLFRTLCKMSMKEESDEVATKTRLLSLELLQGLLEGVSDLFAKNFHFIDSVKAYLSYALLRASVSSSQVVFQYASGIFSVLLLRFRESLKGEIGVFFPLIVLRSLDSSDSSLSQKSSVLRMLEKVCKDSQMLADMFVNYDCDLEGPNLFERMVSALSRIAHGSQSVDSTAVAASQTVSVKGSSLQCLVSILKSLVDWEQARRDSSNKGSVVESHEDDASARSLATDETKVQEDDRHQFERAKAHKSTMEAAVSEFNRKPAKGVEYLLSNKLIENNASSVAQFLKNNSSLNKVMIGEYLGQHEEFPLAVMHAYVDSMKFSGLKFDAAIREFLKGFRLPGEAQKIDRIMEKFAERYCADNPGLFKQRSSQTPTTTAMSPSPLAILLLLAVAAPLAYGACEGDASLKGVANDVLLEYGLPKGLLPDSVVSYTFINATGDFKIELASSCYIWFGDHYTYFDKNLSGTISQGTIYNLSGIQAKKLFIWVYITSMVARPERGMIEFHAGFITEDVPMSLFQKVPVCSNGVGDQLRGAAGVMNLLPVAEV